MQTGDTYNKLTAIKEVKKQQSAVWMFECVCGKQIKAFLTNVQSGNTKSCGCVYRAKDYRKELAAFKLSVSELEVATGEPRRKVLAWFRDYGPRVRKEHIEQIKEYLDYVNANKI